MSQNVAEKFQCEPCDYTCCKKSDMNKHILTRKHQNRINRIELIKKVATPKYVCSQCNKEYTARNSLWYHQKKCTQVPEDNNSIVNRLLDENKELRNFIIEQSRVLTEHQKETSDIINKVVELTKTPNTVINQTTNNNNNQRFNINLFLNETCKDAINFSDFVKNIQISYEDLENNAQLGFVNGISKIFLDNLKQLDVNERPIHCTDVKRETMYIKDENEWTKQSDDEKLQKAIQTVSYRSMGKLAEWKQENPDYKDCNSEFSQKCLDIQKQTLAGSDRGVYYPKVIHALAREVVVEK